MKNGIISKRVVTRIVSFVLLLAIIACQAVPAFAGYSIPTPKLKSVQNVNEGVKLTWEKSTGATKYRVFRKANGATSWSKLAVTAQTSYTDPTVTSGDTYTYTVRCLSSDEKTYTSSYNAVGLTIKYIASPKLKSAENVNGGVKLTWEKSTGAAKYRVFRKANDATSWSKLTVTTSTSYTDTSVISGTQYTYTVRCLSSDEKTYTSSYNGTGLTIKYIASPRLKGLEIINNGVKLTWEKSTGADKYRVFRKANGATSWSKLTVTTSTSYTDTSVISGTQYTYTVRCLSNDEKKYTSSYDGIGLTILYEANESINPYDYGMPPTRILKSGSTGDDVKWVQATLKRYGVYSSGKIDGQYGSSTVSAVKKFQTKKGLEVDGKCGPITTQALIDYLDSIGIKQPVNNNADKLIAEAKKYLGVPYVWGGYNPNTGFDCSGFVSYAINHSGIGINWGHLTAEGLRKKCTKISSSSAKPGDLIFFKGTYDVDGASHVGIYLGNNQMIHASSSSGKVIISASNTSYWSEHFYCYGRIPGVN